MGLPVTRVISRIMLQVRNRSITVLLMGQGGGGACAHHAAGKQSLVVCNCVSAAGGPAGHLAACLKPREGLAVHAALPCVRRINAPLLCLHRLQEILADACRALAGDGIILNSVNVVDYEQGVDPKTGRKVRSRERVLVGCLQATRACLQGSWAG